MKSTLTLFLSCCLALIFSATAFATDFAYKPKSLRQKIDIQSFGAAPEPAYLGAFVAQADEEDEDDDDEEEGGDDFEDEFDEEPTTQRSDPLSGYNEVMTGFNDGVYTYALDPVARGYRWILPEEPRQGVANFFNNIWFPIRLVNNLLQGEFADSAEETGRFVINSTIGILGFFDPAKHWFDLEAHPEDFGQTLGVWGVGPGPHIVLPFLGPSNLRDMFALAPDYYIDPITYVQPTETSWGLVIYETVNDTSLHIGDYENLKKGVFELYPFLREAYEQNRIKKIKE